MCSNSPPKMEVHDTSSDNELSNHEAGANQTTGPLQRSASNAGLSYSGVLQTRPQQVELLISSGRAGVDQTAATDNRSLTATD